MNINRHEGSYGLTAATIQQVIAVNEAYKKLSLSVFIGSPMNPIHPDYVNIPNRIYIAHLYARLRAAVRGLRDQNVIDTVAIGEFLAYDLPLDYYNSPDDASNAIIQVMKYILDNNLVQQYSALTPEFMPHYQQKTGLIGLLSLGSRIITHSLKQNLQL